MERLAHSSGLTEDLASVLSGLQEGVTVTDVATQRLVFANETAARMSGYATVEDMVATPRELHAQRIQFLDERGQPLPPERLPHLRALRGEQPPPMELRTRLLALNEEHWATLSAIPLLNEGGQVRQVVSIFRRTTEQRRAERALRFLVRATEVLNESLDDERTLQALAQLVVPELAESCMLLLREEGGGMRRLSAHESPELEQRMQEMWRRYRFPADAPLGPAYVMRTGKPSLVPEYTPEIIRAFTQDEAHARLYESLGYRSGLSVPLVARGRLLGVLHLALIARGRRFDDSDVELASELASRAAQALDNARLYRDARTALARKDEEARESDRLRRLGNALVAELDPARLLQLLLDEATAACGARLGAFVPRQEGALPECVCGGSGAALPALPRERLRPVFEQGRALRLACAAAGPGGWPWGLLAIPVLAESGEPVGALALWQPEPGAFTARHEQLATALAAQACIALANARNVQQARDAEARSRASEERLLLALGAGQLAYFDVDRRTGKVTCSPEFEALLGFAPGSYDGRGQTLYDRVFAADREPLMHRLAEHIREGVSQTVFECRIGGGDAPIRWLEVHLRLVRDGAGQRPFRYIGVIRDITDRKQAEDHARTLAREQAARAEAEAARQRISDILESIGEPLFAVDRSWRFSFLNRRAEALLGMPREQAVGRDARELFPDAQVGTVREQLVRALQRGGLVELEHSLENGQWIEVRASAFDQGVSVYVRDITARKREQEADARRRRYEALRADVGAALASDAALGETLQRCAEALLRHLDLGMASVWTLDAQSGELELKARALQPGPTPPEGVFDRLPLNGSFLGQLVQERRCLATNELGRLSRLLVRDWAQREGFTAFAGYPLLIGDQAIGAIALFSRQPFHDDLQPALGATADTIAQGLQRRRAEEALARHAEDLARSNRELEQFAYVASHDLQEPLRMVAGYTQLLARRYQGKLDAEADEFIRFAVEGAHRMKRLIGDLLTYSRVGTQGKPLVPTPCGQVLEHVLANLQPVIEESGAEVTSTPMPEVLGDEVQLEQLLQNLTSNALKFRGEARPRIQISAEPREGLWLFSVKDNGIGIDPKDSGRLFVIFQRLHGRDAYPGTGIGLAVCKRIVERHGGRIWLESAPGQGTTFFFTLQPAGPLPNARDEAA